MADLHVGDVGQQITRTITNADGTARDISAATTIEFVVYKPSSGTTAVFTASFVTDGTDGQITYSTQAADIDEPGLWRLQAHIVAAGEEFWTDEGELVVGLSHS